MCVCVCACVRLGALGGPGLGFLSESRRRGGGGAFGWREGFIGLVGFGADVDVCVGSSKSA